MVQCGLILASVLLPLLEVPASPAAWEKQLDDLAGEIAARLAHPCDERAAPDEESRRFQRALELATVWPRPEFREPLRRVLGSDQPCSVGSAARALLNFPDPELRDRATAFQSDQRVCFCGDMGSNIGSAVFMALRNQSPGQVFGNHPDTLIEFDQYQDVLLGTADADQRGVGAMTIPRAVAALQDQSLSIRLQGFAWLDRHGLVLDTRPLEEGWPRLDDARREALLSVVVPELRLGGQTLCDALDRILAARCDVRVSDRALGRVLVRAARLDSTLAQHVALEIIDADLRGAYHPPAPRAALAAFALEAWASKSEARELEHALEWARSPDADYRTAALRLLGRSDDRRAVEAVLTHLSTAARPYLPTYPLHSQPLLLAFEHRAWPDPRIKWQYLRRIAELMQYPVPTRTRTPLDPPDDRIASVELANGYSVRDMIHLLEAITGVRNGSDGFMNPVYDNHITWQTAENWITWIKKNDPYAP